jgi:hypothetical protein
MTMSKLNFRVILAVLISLAVIFAVYTTVQSASLNASAEKVGSHSVSGLMTNFNHDRFTVAEQEAYQAERDALNNSNKGSGHGCDRESFNSPID